MALLEIRGLHVSYGQIEAIHGVDMDVDAGKITVIIGSNGAGKTTILNAVSGMVKHTGTISLNGAALPAHSHKVVSAGIVQVPEGRRIFAGLSVEENLRLGAYLNRSAKEVRALLDKQYELFPRRRSAVTRMRARSPAANSRCARSAAASWPSRRSSCWTSPLWAWRPSS